MRDDVHLAQPIVTDRLRLRVLRDDDVPALLAYRGLADVCRYLPFPPMDAAEVRHRLETQWRATRLAHDGDAVTLGIERRDSGELVGDAVLFVRSRADAGGEIGWVLHPAQTGHGFATEAAGALLAVAFDGVGMHRVIAQMHPANTASARVAERLGMRREALHRSDALVKGVWEDTLLYALLEDEWRAAAPTR